LFLFILPDIKNKNRIYIQYYPTLFNIYVGNHNPATAHVVQLQFVENMAFGCFVHVVLGEINDAMYILRLVLFVCFHAHDLFQIIIVFVSQHMAARITFDRDDHLKKLGCFFN